MLNRAYDSDLQMYYFINEDSSISYDSPCEVQYTPEIKANNSKSGHFAALKRKKSSSSSTSSCESKKSASSSTSVLSKITSVLSRRSSNCSFKSRNSITRSVSASSTESVSSEKINNYKNEIVKMHTFNVPSFEDSNSIISGLDDEYLLDNPIHYRHGQLNKNNFNGYQSDESSLSEESIHSYYSEIAGEEYYYEYEEESIYDLEKEKERLELRMQIRQELEA